MSKDQTSRKGAGIMSRHNGARTGLQIKSAPLRVKATDEAEGEGIVRGVASVWGNIDSYGDVMIKGAFAESLAEYKDAGDSVPFMWSHESSDPFAYVGELTDTKETDEGLEFEAKFDMDNPTAAQVYRLLKGRRLREFSFGFLPRETEQTERDGEPVREVKSVELLEVSVVHVGANRATRVIEVRSHPEGKADDEGEEPSEGEAPEDTAAIIAAIRSAAETIVTAAGTIASKLDELEGESGETEERAAASEEPRRDEEHNGAKSSRTGDDAAAATGTEVSMKAWALLAQLDAEKVISNG